MTAKKDFKRRVRERQAKTGESYTAARAQVMAQAGGEATVEEAKAASKDETKPSAISVVELVDASEEARSLGLRCDVLVSPSLAAHIPPVEILEQVLEALLATENDPQLSLLRGALFRGESPPHNPHINMRARWEDTKRFFTRAGVGIGGINQEGDMLALQVENSMVLVQISAVPHMPPIRRAQLRVFLTTVDAHQLDSRRAALMPRFP
jgi:hypothetical protein